MATSIHTLAGFPTIIFTNTENPVYRPNGSQALIDDIDNFIKRNSFNHDGQIISIQTLASNEDILELQGKMYNINGNYYNLARSKDSSSIGMVILEPASDFLSAMLKDSSAVIIEQ